MGGGGGGGSARASAGPIRNAVMNSGTQATVQQTQCPGGRCPVPGRVIRSSPVITSASPSVVSSSTAIPYAPQGDSTARSDAFVDSAIGLARDQPAVAGTLMMGAGLAGVRGEKDAQRDHESRNDAFNRQTATKAAEIAQQQANTAQYEQETKRTEVESIAEKNRSDARLNDSTAAAIDQKVGTKRLRDQQLILQDAVMTGATPQAYADAMIAFEMPLQAEGAEKGVTFPAQSDSSIENKRKEYLRQGYAAQGVHIVITSEAFHELATQRPVDQVGIARTAGMVGKDPKTGEPIEFSQDQTYPKDMARRKDEAIGRALDSIASGYAEAGLLGQGWPKVKAALDADVYGPMRKYATQSFMEKNKSQLDALPKEYRAEAEVALRGQATRVAEDFVQMVEDQLAIRNRKAGGGTPDNPTGSGLWLRPQQPGNTATPSYIE